MSEATYFKLNGLSVVDVTGADAAAIVNNLATNEVIGLADAEGRETFITDVRGKTLGHVLLVRQSDTIRLIGASGQSEAIANHIDRYTIREDATPLIRADEFTGVVLAADAAEQANLFADTPGSQPNQSIAAFQLVIGGLEVAVYRNEWLGRGTVLLLVPNQDVSNLEAELAKQSLASGTDGGFHALRIGAGFPWYGIDLNDSNLPQELDRDARAISFTKGCYLGQETVARLDALGQVQRKLVRWSIRGACPPADTPLEFDDKKVGRLTSVAALANGDSQALGYARRSHFESGATAVGNDSGSGSDFTATVG